MGLTPLLLSPQKPIATAQINYFRRFFKNLQHSKETPRAACRSSRLPRTQAHGDEVTAETAGSATRKPVA
jgi:hypothetical protein